jgi:hypothetical protein
MGESRSTGSHRRGRLPAGAAAIALVLLAAAGAPARGGEPAVPQAAPAAGAAASSQDLAKQLSNPVASLVSVPFQFNWDQPVGPDDASRFVMNLQPVVPMSVSDDWNLILRWIMPFVGQPVLFEGGQPASGMGDIVASFFLSPARPGKLIWGAGPVLVLPTNSDPVLGSSRWSAGPTVVVLKQSGGFTYGMLANHVWSFAGPGTSGGVERADVSASFLQPFVSYTTKSAVTIALNAEASANWRLYRTAADGSLEEKDGTDWTVPINMTVTKLTKFGPLPMSIGGGVGVFVETPDGRPDWRLRLVATILLPRK